MEKLEEKARILVDAAVRAGADACDVVVANGQSLGVSVRDGKVENTGRSESDDLSLRVFVGKRVAAISSNQFAGIDELARRAVSMARVSPEDPWQGLADPGLLAASWLDLDLWDDGVPLAARLADRALEAEAAGLSVDGVSKSMGASAGWGETGFVLATSHGFSGSYRRSGFSVSAAMVSGEGASMERDHDYHGAVHEADLKSATEIGRQAGMRAVRRRNPRKPGSASLPVIFDRRVSASLLGALLGAINASAVVRKTSFLRDRMGKQVAHPSVTVRDDPLRPRATGSRPFDGEGVACAPIDLVDGGVLNAWLLDSATARELDMTTNARASRGGSGTSPTSTNAWIAKGGKSVEEMAKDIGTGLYVTETIGHGVNMVTGDFSKGASGFWIENGEIAYPVAEITIAGNLRDMFLSMQPASDLEFRHSVNAPSLLVEGMTIGGR